MDYFAAIATPNTMKAPSASSGPTPSSVNIGNKGDDSRVRGHDKSHNKTSFGQHLARESKTSAAKSSNADHPASTATQPLKEQKASTSAENTKNKAPVAQDDNPVEEQQSGKKEHKAVAGSDDPKKKTADTRGDQPVAVQNTMPDGTGNATVTPPATTAKTENTVQDATAGQKQISEITPSLEKENTSGARPGAIAEGQPRDGNNSQGPGGDDNAVPAKDISGKILTESDTAQPSAKKKVFVNSQSTTTKVAEIPADTMSDSANGGPADKGDDIFPVGAAHSRTKAQDTLKAGQRSDAAAQLAAAGGQPVQQDQKLAQKGQQGPQTTIDHSTGTGISGLNGHQAGQQAAGTPPDGGKDNSPHNQTQNQNQANIQTAAQEAQAKTQVTAVNAASPFATMLKDGPGKIGMGETGMSKDGGQTGTTNPAGNSLPFATLGATQGSAIPAHVAATHGTDRGYMPNGAPLVASQVAVQISKTIGDGKQEFSIRLDPADLGRVDVKLSFHGDGKVTASISADHQHTLDLLQRDARTLDKALQNAGLQTGNGSLSFSLRQQGQNQQQQQNFTSGGGHSGWTPGIAALPDDDVPDTAAVWTGQTDRSLDIRI